MRKTELVLVSLVSLAFAAVAQQPGAVSPAGQIQSPVVARSIHAGGARASSPASCPAAFNDSLATDGIVGKDRDGVALPKPVFRPEAQLSEEARSYIQKQHIKNFKATALFSLVIDREGRPQNPCLLKAAGHGLDRQAEKAVRQYKFAPATKDGKPVPMRIVVELNFKTY